MNNNYDINPKILELYRQNPNPDYWLHGQDNRQPQHDASFNNKILSSIPDAPPNKTRGQNLKSYTVPYTSFVKKISQEKGLPYKQILKDVEVKNMWRSLYANNSTLKSLETKAEKVPKLYDDSQELLKDKPQRFLDVRYDSDPELVSPEYKAKLGIVPPPQSNLTDISRSFPELGKAYYENLDNPVKAEFRKHANPNIFPAFSDKTMIKVKNIIDKLAGNVFELNPFGQLGITLIEKGFAPDREIYEFQLTQEQRALCNRVSSRINMVQPNNLDDLVNIETAFLNLYAIPSRYTRLFSLIVGHKISTCFFTSKLKLNNVVDFYKYILTKSGLKYLIKGIPEEDKDLVATAYIDGNQAVGIENMTRLQSDHFLQGRAEETYQPIYHKDYETYPEPEEEEEEDLPPIVEETITTPIHVSPQTKNFNRLSLRSINELTPNTVILHYGKLRYFLGFVGDDKMAVYSTLTTDIWEDGKTTFRELKFGQGRTFNITPTDDINAPVKVSKAEMTGYLPDEIINDIFNITGQGLTGGVFKDSLDLMQKRFSVKSLTRLAEEGGVYIYKIQL